MQGQVNITHLLFGFLFFIGLIAAGALFAEKIFEQYNPNASNNLSAIKDISEQSETIKTITSDVQTRFEGGGFDIITVIATAFFIGFEALIQILTLPTTLANLITQMAAILLIPIPDWAITLAIGIFGVFILFRIVGIVTRSQGGGV